MRRITWKLSWILSICIAVLAVAGASFGQNFRLQTATGDKAPQDMPPFAHWDLREFPGCNVPWSFGNKPVPDLDGNGTANEPTDVALWINLTQAAFLKWNNVAPSELGLIMTSGPGQPGGGGFALDNWNLISWSDTLQVSVLAITGLWWNNTSGVITEADILMNSNFVPGGDAGIHKWVVKANGAACAADLDFFPTGNWPTPADGDTDVNGDGQQRYEVDLLSVITHEVGHFVGLAHIDPNGGQMNVAGRAVMEELWGSFIGPTGGGVANQTLKAQDVDGENFLYTPDLGDAPDPWMGVTNLYPTLVHIGNGRTLNGITLKGTGLGAQHIMGIKPQQSFRNWTYEWLARFMGQPGADSECDANVTDRDPLDNGVTWYPNPPVWGRPMTVRAWVKYASDNAGNAHNYFLHPMWVNGWLDPDQNCVFDHFMHNALSLPAPVGVNSVQERTTDGSVVLPQFVDPTLPVWLRVRLDYGEDVSPAIDPTLVGAKGAAQLGEVEDYPFYCTTKYVVVRLCNPFPFPIPGVAMVFVGAPQAQDYSLSKLVDENDCETADNPPPITTYNAIADETIIDCPGIVIIPPNTYIRTGRCRPNSPPSTPPAAQTRMAIVTPEVPATTPAQLVPNQMRVPTTNCGATYLQDVENPGTIRITVGAVDFANGGWIDGPDAITGQWEDTLSVTVGYRISPQLVPLDNLSPCDPLYSSLPLVPVGTGNVTPEDGFDFSLDVPGDVPVGHYVIVEVQSSWSTNATVSNEIIEFQTAVGGGPTAVETPVVPKQLALDNFPNPFNPITTIRYALPQPTGVSLAIYDVGGRRVRTLLRDVKRAAGVFEVEWNGRDDAGSTVASGVYFYRIDAGDESLTRKMVLLK